METFTSQQKVPYERDGHKYLGDLRLYEEELQAFEQAGGVSTPIRPPVGASEAAWEKYREQCVKHKHFERRQNFEPKEDPPPPTGSVFGMFIKLMQPRKCTDDTDMHATVRRRHQQWQ